MKAAKNRVRSDSAGRLNFAKLRRVLLQRAMRSGFVVIIGVSSQRSAQMRFARNDQMINALASDRPNQPFGISVLPWRRRRDWLVSDAHGPQPPPDDRAESAISVADEIAGRFVPGESLGDLTRDPLRGGMGSYICPN